jgi:hypothetical protein
VDGNDIVGFVPQALESWYPGCSHELAHGRGPDVGWVLEAEGAVAVVRAVGTSRPFVWLRAGIAHTIPRADALAWHVASKNKDLMAGRVYATSSDDLAMVVFDEAILGPAISYQHQPSIQDVRTRLDIGLECAAQWSAEVRETFGGQAFTPADWGKLLF